MEHSEHVKWVFYRRRCPLFEQLTFRLHPVIGIVLTQLNVHFLGAGSRNLIGQRITIPF
jgi:hypothetical protein